jgi:hypothetical protein
MPFRAVVLCLFVLSAVVLAGCTGLEKSENPLAPTVAGPIAGVNIGQPLPLGPKDGVNIEVAAQPVTLTITNAQTNGVRPLSYVFEVAADAGFTNKVFVRDGVTPGGNGQTALRLSDALASGRTYYWRSKAYDGANTGEYSGLSHFNIFTPIVIDKPGPQHPINNVQLDDGTPTFTFVNAPRQGPVGTFIYRVEVSENDAFAGLFAVWQVIEQPNVTRLDAPSALPGGHQYFWRTRASDGANTGPWSNTQVFRVVAPAPPPIGGGGGGDGHSGHIPPGSSTDVRARQVVIGTGNEFQNLVKQNTEDAGEQLTLRMIWHLKLAGFTAGRQRNPSGIISKDKLAIVLVDGAQHVYDVWSTTGAGALDVHFDEVPLPNLVPDPGIPD